MRKPYQVTIITLILVTAVFAMSLPGVVAERNKMVPGVLLTFDDHGIAGWYDTRDLFNKYDVKATFFVDKIYKLDREKLNMLKALRDDGHEIACHGFNHLDAKEFTHFNSLDDYINYEVMPSIKLMTDKGFPPTSFAYPFGTRTNDIDRAMLEKFLILRGTAYTNSEQRIKDLDIAYYNPKEGGKLIHAVGIDEIYGNTVDEILEGLCRARNNGEILMLYSHLIGDSEGECGGKYFTNKAKLERVFQYVSENSLKFYKVSELDQFNN
ncbi:MAG TPA: polysaccharide deacetylase family protein [Clostridia bacterium]|nr:polysaccharide deacetylase family protein [Clostridia bacterium]